MPYTEQGLGGSWVSLLSLLPNPSATTYHQPLYYPKLLMDDLGKWSQAVGGTGCIAEMAHTCKGAVRGVTASPPPSSPWLCTSLGLMTSQDGDERAQWGGIQAAETPMVQLGRLPKHILQKLCISNRWS